MRLFKAKNSIKFFPRFQFSSTTTGYFDNKSLVQKEKIANSFVHDPSKLVSLDINMKQLSPNFFTKCLPIYETKKTIMEDKSVNILDNSFMAVDVHVSSDP